MALFNDRAGVWNVDALRTVDARVDRPDLGSGTWIDKLVVQLEDLSAEEIQSGLSCSTCSSFLSRTRTGAGGIKQHENELLMGHEVAGTTGRYPHVTRETFERVDVDEDAV